MMRLRWGILWRALLTPRGGGGMFGPTMSPSRFPAAVVLCLLIPLLIAGRAFAVDSLSLTPFVCCDGQFISTNVAGQPVWQNTGASAYMYFDVPGTFTFTSGVPVYVRVVYYDAGYGTVAIHYDSVSAGSYQRSELHSRSSRVNSGAFVTNYHQIAAPAFQGRENGGADFRLNLQAGTLVPLSVRSVMIQNFPFADPQLQAMVAKPWLQPYAGPERDDVDRTTLQGRMMAGYQGWFRAPNDYSDGDWGHWVSGAMDPASYRIDIWPDLTDYGPQERFRAADLKTRSGRPAELFSSTIPETVRRHFRWMRKYNMDGAFLQRFVTKGNSGAYGNTEWVLNAVRAAAHQEGRVWAIEYDISSLNDTNALEVMTNDWRWLCDAVHIRQDTRYAYEGTQPVVAIWGLPFSDRAISKATGDAIVDFFRNDPAYGGNYVIGGVPNGWRSMTAWYDHFQRYNCLLAWMPGSASAYQLDLQQAHAWGLEYFPHVWPGFSWAHLKSLPDESQYTPRNGGEFFWRKISEAISAAPTRLFIGMFDEYDEGTAIMPFTDDPPPPRDSAGRFITNLGRPVDWWMLLAGEAREMMNGQRPYSANAPAEAEFVNRPNIGPEGSIDLGSANVENSLALVANPDGNSMAETFSGRDCRVNSNPGSDHYFYFNVADTFLNADAAGRAVTVEFDYHDAAGNVPLRLQYDSTNNIYATHPKTYVTSGSGTWRTARFSMADAFFGNRQNGGADFRIAIGADAAIHIDRARVMLADPLKFQPPAVTLVSTGSVWKYLDDGSNQGTGWRAPGFNDSAWRTGPGQLGYGEGDEATTVSFGANSSLRNITTYFRRTFVVADPGQYVTLVLAILRDDAAVVYLNGQEVYRTLLPGGTITSTTFATNTVSGNDEVGRFERNVDPALLVAGTNVLAVEIHQPDRTSSDLSFDFMLAGFPMTNLPAGVHLAAPDNGAEFLAPTNIVLSAVASSGSTAAVLRVEFFADTNKIGETAQVPYRMTWGSAPLGTFALTALATIAGGLLMTSAPVTIQVKPYVITTTLVPRGSAWKYLDDGSNQGNAWRSTNFNDTAWKSGAARLGYGGDGEVTLLGFGPNPSAKYITYYFRRAFSVSDLSVMTNLTYRLLRDDGAVVYLNSNEVFRSNMPGGTVSYSTLASGAVSGTEEQTFLETTAGAAGLRLGTNFLCVEIHQSDGTSSDIGFDLEVIATGPPPPPPRLLIGRSGPDLRLSWPTNAGAFQLEYAPGLGAPILWGALTGPVMTSNADNFVITSVTNAGGLFHLKRP